MKRSTKAHELARTEVLFVRLCVISWIVLLVSSSTVSAKEPITIHLAGDSTMAQKLPEKRPETGWGEYLQGFFDEHIVRVENHARNGRSTRTFIEEGYVKHSGTG